MYDSKNNWIEEDFKDPPSPDLSVDDPWDIPIAVNETRDSIETEHLTPYSETTGDLSSADSSNLSDVAQQQQTAKKQEFATHDDVHENDVNPQNESRAISDRRNGHGIPPEQFDTFTDDATLGDDPDDDDWGLGELDDTDPASAWKTLYDTDDNEVIEDEPEPIAEYDSELSDPLHELDEATTDLTIAIKVNEWLSTVEEMDEDQRQEITDILLDFKIERLRSWLPWLREKTWTGYTLLLFLQFRAYYDENPELWKRLKWNSKAKTWKWVEDHYSLSRDDSYLLMERKEHFGRDEIVAIEWCEDYDCLDAQVLREQGFLSLADFAVYRSQFHIGEDWRRRPDLGVDFDYKIRAKKKHISNIHTDLLRMEISNPYDYTLPMANYHADLAWTGRHNPLENWFEIHDWYSQEEWFDG